MSKYVVEFIGTFFLVLSIVITVNSDFQTNLQPIAIGTMLMVMVYSGSHISGAHFNPAVTLAFWSLKKFAGIAVPGYIFAQLAAAAMAAYVGGSILGKIASTPPVDMEIISGMVAEILGTFVLVWVILNVALAPRLKGNSYYGIAIGFTVTAIAYTFGGFGSAGCFNPAVVLSSFINGSNTIANIGPIILANIIGAALAALTFRLLINYQGPNTQEELS